MNGPLHQPTCGPFRKSPKVFFPNFEKNQLFKIETLGVSGRFLFVSIEPVVTCSELQKMRERSAFVADLFRSASSVFPVPCYVHHFFPALLRWITYSTFFWPSPFDKRRNHQHHMVRHAFKPAENDVTEFERW